jgi:hypothetical protein
VIVMVHAPGVVNVTFTPDAVQCPVALTTDTGIPSRISTRFVVRSYCVELNVATEGAMFGITKSGIAVDPALMYGTA